MYFIVISLFSLLINSVAAFDGNDDSMFQRSEDLKRNRKEKSIYIDLNGYVWEDKTKQILISAPDNLEKFTLLSSIKTIKGGNNKEMGCFYICRNTLKAAIFTLLNNDEENNLETIEGFAFSSMTYLDTVDLSKCSKLTKLGNCVFQYCTKLKNVILPQNILEIPSGAFQYCYGLSTITIPKKIEVLRGYIDVDNRGSFYASGLTQVIFEEDSNLRIIEYHSFSNTLLTSILIPKSVTTIGNVFVECNQMEKIEVEEGNTYFKIINNGLYSYKGETFIFFPPKAGKTFDIEEGCKTTYSGFWGNRLIEYITIPSTLVTIGNNLCSYCVSLLNITFSPNSVLDTISATSFIGCISLTIVVLPSTINTIGQGAFANCPLLDLRIDPSSTSDIYINNSMLIKGKTVVSYFGTDEEMTFGPEIENIGAYSFYKTSIVHLVIPKTINNVWGSAFIECSKIIDVVIENEEISIANRAFSGCSSLETITFANNLTKNKEIPSEFLRSTKNLNTFIVPKNIEIIQTSCFDGSGIRSIIFTEDSKLKEIEQFVFRYVNNLKEIIFPKTIEKINSYSFDFSMIQNICFKEDISGNANKTFLDGAFSNMIKLEKIEMPKTVKSISRNCFKNCYLLKTIIIPEVIEGIGEFAFENCEMLEMIKIEGTSNLESIVGGAFVGCKKLKNIEISAEHKYFKFDEKELVLYNKDITTIVVYLPINTNENYIVPITVTDILAHSFEYAQNLKDLIIPNETSIQTLGYRSFRGCVGLSAIEIPDTVTDIGAEAFIETSITKCESVKYKNHDNDVIYNKLLRSGIPEVALNKCPPTSVFTGRLKISRPFYCILLFNFIVNL